MRIFYTIYNEWTKEQAKILAGYNINVSLKFESFEVDEETFRRIEDYITKWNCSISYGSLYDKKDIDESELLVFAGVWDNGYPQPEEVNDYLKATYDLSNFCGFCGIGAIQKAPFRIKKDPSWGTKKMFQLKWVYDEIFIKKEFYELFFKPKGIEYMPVVLHKSSLVSESTVQLIIKKVNQNSLLLKNHPHKKCKECGRIKYHPGNKGYLENFEKSIHDSLKIFKSTEYFGDMGKAYNRVYLVKGLADELRREGVKANLWPVR